MGKKEGEIVNISHTFNKIIGHHWKMKTRRKSNITRADRLCLSIFESVTLDDVVLADRLIFIQMAPYDKDITPKQNISRTKIDWLYFCPAKVRKSIKHLK